MVNNLEHGELSMRMAMRFTIHTRHRELEPCAKMGQRVLQLAEEPAHGTEVLHSGYIKA